MEAFKNHKCESFEKAEKDECKHALKIFCLPYSFKVKFCFLRMINYSLNSQNYLTLKTEYKKSFNFKNRGFPHNI